MANEKQLRRLLKTSIKMQESLLKTVKDLGYKAQVDSIALRLLLNKYSKFIEKVKQVIDE